MKTRYQQPLLVRQLALVNRLLPWKCLNEANPTDGFRSGVTCSKRFSVYKPFRKVLEGCDG
ncbi:hypothetical protein V1508DRAFT_422500 [Lipomyces doorenjongii]|uniref:uncharacterized protein n=1 Tax=Lipomyces doorenjongii TaxID=383834 RepID=UPI0034CE08AD